MKRKDLVKYILLKRKYQRGYFLLKRKGLDIFVL
jgi:hypothetical protein